MWPDRITDLWQPGQIDGRTNGQTGKQESSKCLGKVKI